MMLIQLGSSALQRGESLKGKVVCNSNGRRRAAAARAAVVVRCVKAAKNDNVIQVGLLNLIGRG